jgi:hypothetical protein
LKQTIEEARALHNLGNDVNWSYSHESGVVWGSDTIPQPTQEEIDAEIVRFTAEDEATLYQQKRRVEYPPIGDQLDDLFHAGAFSTEMGAKLQAVKDAHPKSTS